MKEIWKEIENTRERGIYIHIHIHTHHTISYHTTLYHTIQYQYPYPYPYHAVPYHTIILHYIALHYIKLHTEQYQPYPVWFVWMWNWTITVYFIKVVTLMEKMMANPWISAVQFSDKPVYETFWTIPCSFDVGSFVRPGLLLGALLLNKCVATWSPSKRFNNLCNAGKGMSCGHRGTQNDHGELWPIGFESEFLGCYNPRIIALNAFS